MGWESRQGKGRYYTRSRRAGARVVREYVGSGPFAELAAELDAEEQAERQAKAEAFRGEWARLAVADAPLAELCDMTNALVRGVLLLAGYHRHHGGEWRRRRGA
ncbi:MAG: hypothetical protein Q8P22_09870 [Chloroflexota bacterium]|nr:hypothetical protein [Chloroflexota bacterium]